MPWKLRPGWRAAIEEGCLTITSDVRKFRVVARAMVASDIVSEFEAGIEASERTQEALDVIARLEAAGLVVDETFSNDTCDKRSSLNSYFSHIGMNNTDCRRAIEAAVVTIVGIGGTGGIILQHLVGAGVRNFILVDYDLIDNTNLERQFIFSPDMVGRPKTDGATAYILDRVPNANVQTYSINIMSNADVQSLCNETSPSTICAICIDTPFEIAVRTLPQALWDNGITSLQGGVMPQSGFFGPVFDPLWSRFTPESFWKDFKTPETASPVNVCFPPTNTVIASLMANQVLHHLIGARHLVDYSARTFVDLFQRRFLRVDRGDIN